MRAVAVKVAGKSALLMPFVAMLEKDDFRDASVVSAARSALQAMAASGLRHDDVRLCHFARCPWGVAGAGLVLIDLTECSAVDDTDEARLEAVGTMSSEFEADLERHGMGSKRRRRL